MFFRRIVTKRNGKKYTYLKLIESYREGGKVKQRVIANLGNIETLNPEKINSLISSLNKLAEPDIPSIADTMPGALAAREQHPTKITDLHHLWHKLGLSDFLYRTIAKKSMDKMPWLVKAMVFQKLLFPAEHRPISVTFQDLHIPELQGQEATGMDFYRAVISLAAIKDQLETHLLETLKKDLGPSPLLYATIISGGYTGQECTINPTGTAYHIRPYTKDMNLLVTLFPPDIPVGCSVCNRGSKETDIQTSYHELNQRLNTETCLIIDARNAKHKISPLDSPFIKSLPPEDFAIIPVSTGDLWQDRDAFTVNNKLWVKDINKANRRYIICHDLHPHAESDRIMEQILNRAEQELEKISQQVKKGRLRREQTISGKINKVLERFGCQGYFNFRLNLETQDLTFSRNEEVIHKLKTLQRTQVLETNIRTGPAIEIVKIFQNRGAVQNAFQLIIDPTKVPVIYPLTELKHNQSYITGQVLIHLMSCMLKKMISNGAAG